jgi:hypothetical protein
VRTSALRPGSSSTSSSLTGYPLAVAALHFGRRAETL